MLALLITFLAIVLRLNLNKKKKGQTENDGTKYIEIMVPLKYLSNFWRTLEMLIMLLIAGAIDGKVLTFAITDTKCYVPAVTLTAHDNIELIQQLKLGFKRTTKPKKY